MDYTKEKEIELLEKLKNDFPFLTFYIQDIDSHIRMNMGGSCRLDMCGYEYGFTFAVSLPSEDRTYKYGLLEGDLDKNYFIFKKQVFREMESWCSHLLKEISRDERMMRKYRLQP